MIIMPALCVGEDLILRHGKLLIQTGTESQEMRGHRPMRKETPLGVRRFP